MDVALLTVGDELLAGDTVNTNAAWLADQLAERGGRVHRILTVPDDRDVIAEWIDRFRTEWDAVVVTGGLGGTPDDVTLEAVAAALGRDSVVYPDVREEFVTKAQRLRDERPEFVAEHDLDFDFDGAARLPEGARPLLTDDGWAAGCIVDNVYAFPGIPAEMQAMFSLVADEFSGNILSETLFTRTPEGAMKDTLSGVRQRFDVEVGSYPADPDTPNRLKITGTDHDEVARATAWLREQVDVVTPPEE